MAIEFQCEHCNKLIRAPENTAGRNGKCPHCKGLNYVPLPEDEVGELPLTPLNEVDERRRKHVAAEDMAVQWKLLHERSSPGEVGDKRSRRASTQVATTAPPSRKQLTAQIVSYVDNMSQGKLIEADGLTRALAGNKPAVERILDEMMSEDLNAYGLPTLPRPVLIGFLKQLRVKI